MSYCRWSSQNFKCDLYSYECVDGTWTTHVARWKAVTPIFPHPSLRWVARFPRLWKAWYVLHNWSIEHSVRRPLGLPYDGETFKDGSPVEFKATLLMLRRTGYRFPDHVLRAVDEEIADGVDG